MLNHFLQCAKSEFAEQSSESGYRAAKAEIVGQTDPFGQRDPGMLGIELPGVNVKIGRQTFRVQRPDVSAREGIRINPKIGSTGAGEHAAPGSDGGNRELAQTQSVRKPDDVQFTRGAGNPVSVVLNRKDARIVADAQLREDVQRPQGIAGDGKVRGAVGQDWPLDRIFRFRLRARNLPPERFPILPINEGMVQAMGADFMSGGRDGSQQRSPRIVAGQQLKQRFRAGLDSAFEPIPPAGRDLDSLIPFLKIDREGIQFPWKRQAAPPTLRAIVQTFGFVDGARRLRIKRQRRQA
jgi:hypothetical protein